MERLTKQLGRTLLEPLPFSAVLFCSFRCTTKSSIQPKIPSETQDISSTSQMTSAPVSGRLTVSDVSSLMNVTPDFLTMALLRHGGRDGVCFDLARLVIVLLPSVQ
jgi:hypothetical protein